MKLPYFKLGDAINDVKNQFSYGDAFDKVGSVAKLAGKTVTNVGLLAVDAVVEIGSDIIKNTPEHTGRIAESILKNSINLTKEKRDQLNEAVEKGKAHKKERYAEEEKAKREAEEKNK